MRLPATSELNNEVARELYAYDIREYFARDRKSHWAVYYRHRLRTMLDAVSSSVPSGGSVLDLGCAQATASLLLAERGFRVTAVDARPECLAYARLRYEYGDITFLNGDVTRLALPSTYDAIVLGEVLEHVPRPRAFLASVRAMLKDGGMLIVTTPNGLCPLNWLTPGYDPDAMEAPDRATLPSGLGGGETHLFCFRPRQLTSAIRVSGFRVEQVKYLNSLLVNKLGLHRVLPVGYVEGMNAATGTVPVLAPQILVVARRVALPIPSACGA